MISWGFASTTIAAAAAVAAASLYTLNRMHVQSNAIVGNRDTPSQCFAISMASMHMSKEAADREFHDTMRDQLDQRRGERVSASRTLYTPNFKLSIGLGQERRYDIPAQRPDNLKWSAPLPEFATALEQTEITQRKR